MGNPLYNWEYHRNTGYQWWISRLAHCYQLYDVVRIDHFRGFDELFFHTGRRRHRDHGTLGEGTGNRLFHRVRRRLAERKIIAEDLGYVTDSVRWLVKETGYPGMKVLEFAFDSRDSGCAGDYLPHNYPENCVSTRELTTMRPSPAGSTPSRRRRGSWPEITCAITTRRIKNSTWPLSASPCEARPECASFLFRITWDFPTDAGSIRPPQWGQTGNGAFCRSR